MKDAAFDRPAFAAKRLAGQQLKIMKKTKLDTKSEIFDDAFFDNENWDKNDALNFAGDTKLSENEKDDGFIPIRKPFVGILKQAFLFLPGAFLLFFMSFGAAIIFMEIAVYGRALKSLPDDFPFQFALIGLIIFAGTLMTWFGLGDIKNRKHFAIPASLIVTGATIGAIVKALSKISDLADKMLDDFYYLIYLFPLALIIPILAKSIIDRKTKDV